MLLNFIYIIRLNFPLLLVLLPFLLLKSSSFSLLATSISLASFKKENSPLSFNRRFFYQLLFISFMLNYLLSLHPTFNPVTSCHVIIFFHFHPFICISFLFFLFLSFTLLCSITFSAFSLALKSDKHVINNPLKYIPLLSFQDEMAINCCTEIKMIQTYGLKPRKENLLRIKHQRKIVNS